jgi:hypothetical protein
MVSNVLTLYDWLLYRTGNCCFYRPDYPETKGVIEMPKLEKSYKRDNKRRREQYGHKEDGRSVKYIQRIIQERAEKARSGK